MFYFLTNTLIDTNEVDSECHINCLNGLIVTNEYQDLYAINSFNKRGKNDENNSKCLYYNDNNVYNILSLDLFPKRAQKFEAKSLLYLHTLTNGFIIYTFSLAN